MPSAGLSFGWSFPYLAHELTGTALAAGLYGVVHPKEYTPGAAATLGAKCCLSSSALSPGLDRGPERLGQILGAALAIFL